MTKCIYDKVSISVIIPSYNSEKTIITTLKSLENQTYKNFEVILVDDGSNDNTHKLIKEYIEYSKLYIRYIRQENSGVSIARNNGLSEARGEYILFLDSDDVYHKQYLDVMINAINVNEVDTAYCFHTRKIKDIINSTTDILSEDINVISQGQLMEDFMLKKAKIVFCNFIYKTQILKKYNIRFTPNVKYGEDLEFVWKYLVRCKNGAVINKELYGYYNNPNSAVNTVNWSKIDLLTSIKSIEKYMELNECDYCDRFKEYMYGRAMWAVAKTFARSDNKDLFRDLRLKFDVKSSMKDMLKCPNLLVKISAVLYLIHPELFYFVVRLV